EMTIAVEIADGDRVRPVARAVARLWPERAAAGPEPYPQRVDGGARVGHGHVHPAVFIQVSNGDAVGVRVGWVVGGGAEGAVALVQAHGDRVRRAVHVGEV